MKEGKKQSQKDGSKIREPNGIGIDGGQRAGLLTGRKRAWAERGGALGDRSDGDLNGCRPTPRDRWDGYDENWRLMSVPPSRKYRVNPSPQCSETNTYE